MLKANAKDTQPKYAGTQGTNPSIPAKTTDTQPALTGDSPRESSPPWGSTDQEFSVWYAQWQKEYYSGRFAWGVYSGPPRRPRPRTRKF